MLILILLVGLSAHVYSSPMTAGRSLDNSDLVGSDFQGSDCDPYCIDHFRHCTKNIPSYSPSGVWYENGMDCNDTNWADHCQRSCEECVPCQFIDVELFEEVIFNLQDKSDDLKKELEAYKLANANSQDQIVADMESEIESLQSQINQVADNTANIFDLLENIMCKHDGDCQNGGTCQVSTGKCDCTAGYKGSCCSKNVNECMEDTDVCGDNGECVDTFGSYTCTCNEGYENGDDTQTTCVDIDECEDDFTCGEQPEFTTCTNLPGTHKCECKNDCLYKSPTDDGMNCVSKAETTPWVAGECSCQCGDGQKILTRKCSYPSGTADSCTTLESTVSGINECGNASLSKTEDCNLGYCMVKKLEVKTQDVSDAKTDDGVEFILFDSAGNKCDLGRVDNSDDNWERGDVEVFNSANDDPGFPYKCSDLCWATGDDLPIAKLTWEPRGTDGWLMEYAKFTVQNEVVQFVNSDNLWVDKPSKMSQTLTPS